MRVGFALFSTALLLGVFACAGARNLQADTIISAQFECNSSNCPSAMNYTGVELDAAAADSQFNNSSVWNHLSAGRPQDSSVTFSNLLDNGGTATAAQLTISYISGAFNTGSFNLPDTYFYSRSNSSFTISGLTANANFTLFLYAYLGPPPVGPRNATFTIGSQSFDTTSASQSSEDRNNAVDGFITGTTSASGTISGTWDLASPNTFGEIDWSGFQLDVASPATVVPEPATWFLLGIGLAACLLLRRKKATSAKHFQN